MCGKKVWWMFLICFSGSNCSWRSFRPLGGVSFYETGSFCEKVLQVPTRIKKTIVEILVLILLQQNGSIIMTEKFCPTNIFSMIRIIDFICFYPRLYTHLTGTFAALQKYFNIHKNYKAKSLPHNEFFVLRVRHWNGLNSLCGVPLYI